MAQHYAIDQSFEIRDLAMIEHGDPPVSVHDTGYGEMKTLSVAPDVNLRLDFG